MEKRNSSALHAFAFPNPFDQSFNLHFDWPSAGKIEVQLLDMAGRTIQSVYQNDYLEAGTQQINITTSRLQNGVYYCRVLGNGQQARIKLVKMN